MTIDINQFDEFFFDETYEKFYLETDFLLAETERLLLNVDVENPDIEELRAIAHAINLIKEIAVMFYSVDIGEIDMSEISNVSESLLDKIGKTEMAISADHISKLLTVKTLLKTEVDRHRFVTPVDQRQIADVNLLNNYMQQRAL